MFDNLRDKAEEQLKAHPDQVEKISDTIIDKAGDAADKATGGKYAEQVDKAQKVADDKIGD
jgi:hypothetical protein